MSAGKFPPLGMESIMPFGKHKGTKIRVLLYSEIGYLQWLIEKGDGFELDNTAFAEYERLVNA